MPELKKVLATLHEMGVKTLDSAADALDGAAGEVLH